ncbi:hypothetical protein EXIGLDRAFT_706795 [Exidia glandulosa HHB12029]|uniref:CDC48 N-terminal subdomain domain-containing protein n=1 Tax=Exidia glandulosa HHB12029 TaxID=1314781 RepID=A0A165K3R8_EXIGL|nr:hypothetical protein EXIGLDRAFT_706795 [Exidia glandulosa HHB12029]
MAATNRPSPMFLTPQYERSPSPVDRLTIFAFPVLLCRPSTPGADSDIQCSPAKSTVPICLSSDDVDEGKIQLNKVARNNLRIKLGDLCSVHACHDIKYGKGIHVLPFDSIEGLSGNLFDVYLKPYFLEEADPVKREEEANLNEIFAVPGQADWGVD